MSTTLSSSRADCAEFSARVELNLYLDLDENHCIHSKYKCNGLKLLTCQPFSASTSEFPPQLHAALKSQSNSLSAIHLLHTKKSVLIMIDFKYLFSMLYFGIHIDTETYEVQP